MKFKNIYRMKEELLKLFKRGKMSIFCMQKNKCKGEKSKEIR